LKEAAINQQAFAAGFDQIFRSSHRTGRAEESYFWHRAAILDCGCAKILGSF
jgi:hypothetical protein